MDLEAPYLSIEMLALAALRCVVRGVEEKNNNEFMLLKIRSPLYYIKNNRFMLLDIHIQIKIIL